MEHYFSNNPTSKSNEREIEYSIDGETLKFISDNGVFSKNHIDFATDLLIRAIIKDKPKGNVLDLGCGYGAIGITISKLMNLEVTMLDINRRALDLTNKNIELNKVKNINVIESDGFDNVKDKFDVIVTNPPIRAGKAVIYKMYEDAKEHLNNYGILYLVINKKHGAPSTIEFLNKVFGNCEVLEKKAGFNVCKSMKKELR
jgi:16S rRNA (guanine1207-N2)-methyltransferase